MTRSAVASEVAAAPLCRGCGRPIAGAYVKAMGACWHPEHFRCAACGRPIGRESFYEHGGAPYHQQCYIERVLPHCAYCGRPLTGTYLTDYWGTKFHPAHETEYPACASCGRLVPELAGTTAADHPFPLCAICRATSVTTHDDARSHFVKVIGWMMRQGLGVDHRIDLHVELADVAAFRGEHGKGNLAALGRTEVTSYTRDGRVVETEVRKVLILRGLPATQFEGVAAHELGHAWLAIEQVRGLPPWAEEGFCELLAHRRYAALATAESRYYAERIEQNPDPVYGAGFRRMQALAKRVGFDGLVASLRTAKTLPGADLAEE